MATLPAPTLDLMADAAMLPPPDLRVPALAPPSLPSLTGAPVVPPMPRLSLDEVDAAIEAAPREIVQVAGPADTDAPELPGAPALPGVPASPAAAPTPTPTIELPVIQDDLLSPANEPLGAPPQVAMVMPSLPTLGAAAPSPVAADDSASHHPSQVGVAPATAHKDAVVAPGGAPKTSGGNLGRSIARTLAAVVLAGVVGVGAHVGYDWWENRDGTAVGGVNVDGTDLASWPQVDPPAIRYTDSETVFTTDAGVRTLTAHREISSGLTQAEVVVADAAGAVVSETGLDIRAEQALVQPAPEAAWTPIAQADAIALLGDTWTSDVFTVRELFPAEAMPYINVLASVERVLPVKPLRPAVGLAAGADAPIAISTEPTSMVWQYRVIIDIESFRANETIVFQEWQRRIGRSAVPRMEASIDSTGIVRQITVEVDGVKVTHTLVGGAATSTRFDTDPLPEVPATPPAPVDASGVEVTE